MPPGASDEAMNIEVIRKMLDLTGQIGELSGELNQLTKKLDDIEERLGKIEQKLDEVNSFRWKVYGAAGALGFLAGLLPTLIALLRGG